jgi:hypothetical protein
VLGRSDADVVVRGTSVSRRHAEIVKEEGRFVVRDLGSRNGTYVAGIKVDCARVPPGTSVRIGTTDLLVTYGAPRISDDVWPETSFHGLVATSMLMREVFGIVARGGAKTILTPPPSAGILKGITRRFVLEVLAPVLGFRVEEKLFRMPELLACDEVFLTGSAAEIIGVSQIDGHVIGQGAARGCVGPETKRLVAAFRERVAKNAPED